MSFAPLKLEERRRVAIRLAGIADAALKLGTRRQVVLVSTYANGPMTGICRIEPPQPGPAASKEEQFAHLCVTLAGRAAQEVICGVTQPLPRRDEARARQTARILCARYAAGDSPEEVMDAAYSFVKKFMDEQRAVVLKLAEELMRKGELQGDEVERLVKEA